MILRRFDNSRAILPVTKNNRELFEKNGFVHFKRCLNEASLKKLQQQLLNLFDNRERDKSFHDIHLAVALKAFKNFELESVLAQYAADLLKSEHVFLYDDRLIGVGNASGEPWRIELKHWPISRTQACCVWIPMTDTPAAFEFLQGSHLEENHLESKILTSAPQTILSDLGDCIIFHGGMSYRRSHQSELKFRDGLMVYIVGDDISTADPNAARHLSSG